MATSVWEIANEASKEMSQFEIHTGNFLDEFYRSGADKRQQMVEREPDHDDPFPVHLLPLLAAMVHKLCNDYDLACPNWVHKIKCVLPEPHFAFNAQGNLRLILLAESPEEFKIRNLFVTANTLPRV
ncbi:MAG: hypothetical protein K0Q73_4294 [Paenibacillus sp.]|jgi:hypothetical protein|nr:hypothetical protein [Paenibacillus sp.]